MLNICLWFLFFSFSLQKKFPGNLGQSQSFHCSVSMTAQISLWNTMFPKKDPDYLFHTSPSLTHPNHPPKTDYSVCRNRKCCCLNKENISKLLSTDSHRQSLFMSFVDPFKKHHFSKVSLLPGEGSLVGVKGVTCKNTKNRVPLLNSRPRNIIQLSSVISVIINLQICLKPKYLYRKKKGKRSSRQTFCESGRKQLQKGPAEVMMQGTASSLRPDRAPSSCYPYVSPSCFWASQPATKLPLQCSHHNGEH